MAPRLAGPRLGLALVLAIPSRGAGAGDLARVLFWKPGVGAVVRSGRAEVRMDQAGTRRGPLVRFPAAGVERVLEPARVSVLAPNRMLLEHQLPAPDGTRLRIVREIAAGSRGEGVVEAVETFRLIPAGSLTLDVEIERPFSVDSRGRGPGAAALKLPRKDGWLEQAMLDGTDTLAEYRLGCVLTGRQVRGLALPVMGIASRGWQAALCADPEYGALFRARRGGRTLQGSIRWRYAGGRIPVIRQETRRFGVWIRAAPRTTEPEGAWVDAFFRLMLPDVAPGPRWLHGIAMVGYDFLSDNGLGWERDVRALAGWLTPAERRRVALCLHGWYDALGTYCFDASAGRIRDHWVAFGRTRKVPLSQDELRKRLRLARSLGFRVLLYFADGLAADSGAPGFRDDWSYRDAAGRRIEGWQGPDTFGTTYLRNPTHPQVFQWHLRYLDALLRAFGSEVDGFVWDETFHAREGQASASPPGWCDRAMLRLVRELARRVHAFDREKVFMASDCIGVPGLEDVPGYAMVAHGCYQDSHCRPAAWSFGLLPSWRNVLWSCNWSAVSNFHYTRFGVEAIGAPVAITNGWGDDRGPSEWTVRERQGILRLFRERLARPGRVRFLAEPPGEALRDAPDRPAPGDLLPRPAPTEVNWALTGARAKASSEDSSDGATWPASGVIDGVRDDTGWGAGHGWASRAGEPLPQWVLVDFGRPRPVARVHVITYQKEGSPETAGKWGVLDYEVQMRSAPEDPWQVVAREARGRAVKVRVHRLPRPVRARQVRILVRRVAPLDGQARLLQVEAWGPGASAASFTRRDTGGTGGRP